MCRRPDLALAVALLLALPSASGAQAANELTLEEFLATAVAHHPWVGQARAARRQADADALTARGAFDPYVAAIWDTKRFKGIGYYDEFDARLVLPTPWGVDFKLGWERAAGQIINPERATPGEGLLSFGVSLPLGPRLVTDERRTARQQAEIAQSAADADLDAALVRVLQGAARDWGLWAEQERRAGITADGIALAEFRMDAVRRRVRAGDAAAIDSVEALAELRTREVQHLDAVAAARAARIQAESWLWDADGRPLPLPPERRPAASATLARESELTGGGAQRLTAVLARHPAVQQATARWRQAEAARRLAAAELLPSASVELSGLAAGSSFGDVNTSLLGEDNKFSGGVRLPLFARRELGRLRAAEQRARAFGIERERIQREVELDAQRALIELDVVDAQLGLQERVVALQAELLAAEQRRFQAGESSLLIVNLRERLLLDERLRLATLVSRRARALGSLAVALGTPQFASGETQTRNGR
jgi:outer membrane protein TolC